MIEEIKKEIENLYFKTHDGCSFLYEINKFLDKYKDKEDKYKNAYEELKENINTIVGDDCNYIKQLIIELETEHGIGVE